MKIKNTFLLNWLICALTLSLSLLGLELLLRKTHWFEARLSWAEPDDLLGWRLAPGKNYFYPHENPKGVFFNINRFGWRDKEWSLNKPAGVTRVAVLGDSYVEALQVEQNATFLSVAEKELRNLTGQEFELMNFGRSGNTQIEEFLTLKEHVMPFNPDLVILFFYPVNDIDDMSPKTSLSLLHPFFTEDPATGKLQMDNSFLKKRGFKFKKMINPLKRHSVLVSLLCERLIMFNRIEQAKNAGILGDDPDAEKNLKGYLSLATATPDPQYARNYALSKRLLHEMQALCRTRGIPLILVAIDIPPYLPEVEKKLMAVNKTFQMNFFDDDLKRLAESEGMGYVGLQRIFSSSYEETGKALHFKYWDTLGTRGYWEYGAHTGHWNYEGHRLVADTIAQKIKELLIQNGALKPGISFHKDSS